MTQIGFSLRLLVVLDPMAKSHSKSTCGSTGSMKKFKRDHVKGKQHG
jgi:hypothetical protein